jgi:hypothetical protein
MAVPSLRPGRIPVCILVEVVQMLRPFLMRSEHLGAAWDQAAEHLVAASGLGMKEGVMRLCHVQIKQMFRGHTLVAERANRSAQNGHTLRVIELAGAPW